MPNKDRLTVDVDDFDLKTLKKMAEEDGYDKLEEYVWVLIQDQIQRRNETEIIVSLPDFILQKLDEEVKADSYDSRSEALSMILRRYYNY